MTGKSKWDAARHVSVTHARTLDPKPVRESQSEITQMVLPNDGNPMGNILGGMVMHQVDIVAAIAAGRHSGSYVVTASMDHMDFRVPIRVGEIIILRASVNRAFRTSMEVGVKVYREGVYNRTREHTSSAYLTFVAVDDDGNPREVPPVITETDDEKRRFREAGQRRERRLADSLAKKNKLNQREKRGPR
ncbi:MAG: acyl-CoA thioesterase [Acidobacteria bacterium]|nr:acyl-CoA thioesterase [Acidobacteriota bacterium]